MTKWIESQIETRAQLDSEALERAYTELAASVSGNRFAPRVTIDDVEQVDGAAKACLKYMGITPGPVPQDVEEVEDRVDWLCRPTQVKSSLCCRVVYGVTTISSRAPDARFT